MNDYTYADICVGHQEKFAVTVGAEQIKLFREITGDANPRHTEQGVVYGLLTASYLSTLAGMYLPGKRSLIQTVRLEFVNTLIVADGEKTLAVSGVVTAKEDRFSLLTVKFSVCGGDGTKFLLGKMNVKVTGDE